MAALRSLIYCYRSGKINNMLGLAMAGILTRPLTCPPLNADTFPYDTFGEMDLIYIALHGSPRARVLHGDEGIPALALERIQDGPRIDGATVILEGCYQAETLFPDAFLERGARVVFASPERTFDRRLGLGAAGKAGMEIVRRLRAGASPEDAVQDSGFLAFAGPDSSSNFV